MLAGMPRDMKCFTCKYRCPVCESSIIIAARDALVLYVSRTRQEEWYVLMFGKPLVGSPIAAEHIKAELITSKFG